MSALVDYVRKHIIMASDSVDTPDHVDVGFFKVQCSDEADASTLRELAQRHPGDYGAVDCFDGYEHGYIELGGWIGDQGLALCFMALGTKLGLFELLTPRAMFGDALTPELEQQMLGRGLLAVRASKGAAACAA